MFKIFDFPNLSRKLFLISEIELVFYNNLLVDAPTAPMRTAGMAITMQPNEAENDKYFAWRDVLQARTL